MTWWGATDAAGGAVRELRIQRAGTERPITGALWTPEGVTNDVPLVLFGHGASGDRYQAPICHLARRLTDVGCASLAIDGPVHGLRQVGSGGRAAFGDEMRREGFVDDMVADWHAALDAAKGKVAVGDIRYFGLSMGSIFGVPLLATLPEVTAAVLGLLGTTGAALPLAERLATDAAEIRCRLLFLMQLEDELFPRDGCLALFDAFASGDKRLHANPGLHPEVPAEEIDCAFQMLAPAR